MTIRIIKTGEVKTVNDNYGLRLITQGAAVREMSAATRKGKKHAAASETEES